MLTRVILLCALIGLTVAEMAFMLPQPVPEKFKGQTGCYLPQEDVVIAYGSAITGKDSCVEYACSESGVTITGCGVAVAGPPCTVKRDMTKPHPDCCPKIHCPK